MPDFNIFRLRYPPAAQPVSACESLSGRAFCPDRGVSSASDVPFDARPPICTPPSRTPRRRNRQPQLRQRTATVNRCSGHELPRLLLCTSSEWQRGHLINRPPHGKDETPPSKQPSKIWRAARRSECRVPSRDCACSRGDCQAERASSVFPKAAGPPAKSGKRPPLGRSRWSLAEHARTARACYSLRQRRGINLPVGRALLPVAVKTGRSARPTTGGSRFSAGAFDSKGLPERGFGGCPLKIGRAAGPSETHFRSLGGLAPSALAGLSWIRRTNARAPLQPGLVQVSARGRESLSRSRFPSASAAWPKKTPDPVRTTRTSNRELL